MTVGNTRVVAERVNAEIKAGWELVDAPPRLKGQPAEASGQLNPKRPPVARRNYLQRDAHHTHHCEDGGCKDAIRRLPHPDRRHHEAKHDGGPAPPSWKWSYAENPLRTASWKAGSWVGSAPSLTMVAGWPRRAHLLSAQCWSLPAIIRTSRTAAEYGTAWYGCHRWH